MFETMKMLAIFSALLAVGVCYPVVKTWTLYELSEAVELNTEPAMTRYYEDAVNRLMLAAHSGKNMDLYLGVVRSPSGGDTWTLDELTNALEDDNLSEEYREKLFDAANTLERENAPNSTEVVIWGVDISTWTLKDLNEALKSPNTKAELIRYLKKARRKMKKSHDKGISKEPIVMITPIGLIPHKGDYDIVPNGAKRLMEKQRQMSLS